MSPRTETFTGAPDSPSILPPQAQEPHTQDQSALQSSSNSSGALTLGIFGLLNAGSGLWIAQHWSTIQNPVFWSLHLSASLFVAGTVLALQWGSLRARLADWKAAPWFLLEVAALFLVLVAFVTAAVAGVSGDGASAATSYASHELALGLATIVSLLSLRWWVADNEVRQVIATYQPERVSQERSVLRISGAGVADSESVLPSTLRTDDIIQISEPDTIPIDGEILEGSALVEERRYSLRRQARLKLAGQRVVAGSTITRGMLRLRVVNRVDETTLSYFLSLRDAVAAPVLAEIVSPRVLYWACGAFTAAVLSILFWRDRGMSWSSALLVGSSVLLISILPDLWRSRPLSFLVALESAFRRGVLVRSERVLSQMGAIQRVIFWANPLAGREQYELVSFEMVDGRCDPRGVREAIVALVTAEDSPWSECCSELLPSGVAAPQVKRVEGVVWYGKYPGLIGSVDGIDASIGNEQFLIERGVPIQGSEILSVGDDELLLFVAFGAEVVARLVVKRTVDRSLRTAVSNLRKARRGILLVGAQSAEELERVATSVGIHRVETRAAISIHELRSLHEASSSALVHGIAGMEKQLANEGWLVTAPFNPLLWELEGADATVLDGGAREITETLRLARIRRRVGVLSSFGVLGLVAVLLVLSLTALIPPWVVASSTLIATLALSLALDFCRVGAGTERAARLP